MWNDVRSTRLSKICVILFMLILAAVVVFAPWWVRWLIETSSPALTGTLGYFLATIYTGFIPAAFLLICLLRLLLRIEKERVFVPENVEDLRKISWCCFAGAGISLISVYYYLPWLILAASAAFMGLIVRVVKNVVAKAVELQDEVDGTI